MVYSVANACRRSLRDPEEGDGFGGLRGFDDRGKIPSPLIESERANLRIAHTTAALVVSDEAGVTPKRIGSSVSKPDSPIHIQDGLTSSQP